ncbi:hypothetical protein EVAR_30611_1 [Eumeta japonica]|uniref:Reverse transcriptase domain-containing protein n=1 Tax=Eumeta variegata TaxID=151549 RepID=A0A4C1WAI2_EUMVA|nr:hypothetical protein EVAR_30611_1 [Eumeta japonica]
MKKRRNNSKTSWIHVIRGVDGHLLNEENNVKERWKNYFESVFVREDTLADDNVTATEYMIDNGNECEIIMDEIMTALTHVDVGKAVRYKDFARDAEGLWRGVKQGCVTSLWLLNLFMASCLYDLQDSECELRIVDFSVKCFLYADDQVIPVSLACGLQDMVSKMNNSVKKRGIKVNVGKTKVMKFERGESTTECDILIEGEKVEQVKEFV